MSANYFPRRGACCKYGSGRTRVAVPEIVAIICLTIFSLACAGVSTGKQNSSVSISIAPTSTTVVSSGTAQFSATVGNTSNTSVTWSASAGTISSTGLFTAPAVNTNTNATVTATSVADPNQSASASVVVTPVGALTIETLYIPDAVAGTTYNTDLTALGGTPPYQWSLSSGNLPSGLQLSARGLISGTTSTLGQFSFTAMVTDTSSPVQTATQSFTLNVDASALEGAIPASFFNLHVNRPNTPWPSAPFVGKRLWDAGVSWALVNTANGVYDWSVLDQRLADAQTHDVDVLYDLARTPVWGQCGPTTSSPCTQTPDCAYAGETWGGGPGQCYWPADLQSDGTGTNQYWKNWITAIATHSVNSSTAHIKYYEIWNEPNSTAFFRGTMAQLVRMTKDAACIIKGIGPGCTRQGIDPSALIVTPAPTQGAMAIDKFMTDFMSLGGGNAVDVIAFHAYNGTEVDRVLDVVNRLKTGSLATYQQTSKPLFDTEFSWGENVTFPDPDERQGFVAISLLLHWSAGVDRVYWYSWDASGTMWSATSIAGCSTPDPSGNGYTCGSAIAYEQLQNWMVGAAMSSTCTATGTVWTCGLIRTGGYEALAVWDTAQSCNHGACTSSKFTVPNTATYVHYRDLAGKVHAITGTTVQIGYKPILLENK
jgi:putative Ig domain-containing protein/putative glycosyl hydrolase